MLPVLIHVHLYYHELWPELRDVVKRLTERAAPYRLVVTQVEPHPEIEEEIHHLFPGSVVKLVPNLGYDIAPFMEVLSEVNLEGFSYVIKLHTKRNVERDMVRLCTVSPFNMKGSRWREALLAFSRPDNMERCLQEFEENSRCGMVAHHLVICPRVTRKDKEQYHIWQEAVELLKPLGLPEPTNQHFVMGSMFMCRAELLKPLQRLNLKLEDFPPPDPQHLKETLAHVLERCFGAVITTQGYEIRDCFSPPRDYVREWLLVILQRLGHFIFSRKMTRKGNWLLKVCKIPVYYGKPMERHRKS